MELKGEWLGIHFLESPSINAPSLGLEVIDQFPRCRVNGGKSRHGIE